MSSKETSSIERAPAPTTPILPFRKTTQSSNVRLPGSKPCLTFTESPTPREARWQGAGVHLRFSAATARE